MLREMPLAVLRGHTRPRNRRECQLGARQFYVADYRP